MLLGSRSRAGDHRWTTPNFCGRGGTIPVCAPLRRPGSGVRRVVICCVEVGMPVTVVVGKATASIQGPLSMESVIIQDPGVPCFCLMFFQGFSDIMSVEIPCRIESCSRLLIHYPRR